MAAPRDIPPPNISNEDIPTPLSSYEFDPTELKALSFEQKHCLKEVKGGRAKPSFMKSRTSNQPPPSTRSAADANNTHGTVIEWNTLGQSPPRSFPSLTPQTSEESFPGVPQLDLAISVNGETTYLTVTMESTKFMHESASDPTSEAPQRSQLSQLLEISPRHNISQPPPTPLEHGLPWTQVRPGGSYALRWSKKALTCLPDPCAHPHISHDIWASVLLVDLSHNSLTGMLPGWIFTHLPNLTYLLARGNQLSDLPSEATCSALQMLDLSHNALLASMSCRANGISAREVDRCPTPPSRPLSPNWASLCLPLSLSNLSSLRILHISNQQPKLSDGRQLRPLASLSNLRELDLSRNAFKDIPCILTAPDTPTMAPSPGPVGQPEAPPVLAPRPQHASMAPMDVSTGAGTPTPPPMATSPLFSSGLAESLVNLNLSDNDMQNELMPSIASMVNLEVLNLNNNNLHGIDAARHLKKLKQLSASRNQLHQVTLQLLDLPNLTKLDLSNNNIRTFARDSLDLERLCSIESAASVDSSVSIPARRPKQISINVDHNDPDMTPPQQAFKSMETLLRYLKLSARVDPMLNIIRTQREKYVCHRRSLQMLDQLQQHCSKPVAHAIMQSDLAVRVFKCQIQRRQQRRPRSRSPGPRPLHSSASMRSIPQHSSLDVTQPLRRTSSTSPMHLSTTHSASDRASTSSTSRDDRPRATGTGRLSTNDRAASDYTAPHHGDDEDVASNGRRRSWANVVTGQETNDTMPEPLESLRHTTSSDTRGRESGYRRSREKSRHVRKSSMSRSPSLSSIRDSDIRKALNDPPAIAYCSALVDILQSSEHGPNNWRRMFCFTETEEFKQCLKMCDGDVTLQGDVCAVHENATVSILVGANERKLYVHGWFTEVSTGGLRSKGTHSDRKQTSTPFRANVSDQVVLVDLLANREPSQPPSPGSLQSNGSTTSRESKPPQTGMANSPMSKRSQRKERRQKKKREKQQLKAAASSDSESVSSSTGSVTSMGQFQSVPNGLVVRAEARGKIETFPLRGSFVELTQDISERFNFRPDTLFIRYMPPGGVELSTIANDDQLNDAFEQLPDTNQGVATPERPSRPFRGLSVESSARTVPSHTPVKLLRVLVWGDQVGSKGNQGSSWATQEHEHIDANEIVLTLLSLCPTCAVRAKKALTQIGFQDPDIEVLAFFSAPRNDPANTSARLDHLQTQREIRDLLKLVPSREVVPAARFPDDVMGYLVPSHDPSQKSFSPRIIQFSGHGRELHEKVVVDGVGVSNRLCPLVFEASRRENGEVTYIPPRNEDLLRVLMGVSRLEGVFLNACETSSYAEYIVKFLNVGVISWRSKVPDLMASLWARVFYEVLGSEYGIDFEHAYHKTNRRYSDIWSQNDRQEQLKKLDLAEPAVPELFQYCQL